MRAAPNVSGVIRPATDWERLRPILCLGMSGLHRLGVSAGPSSGCPAFGYPRHHLSFSLALKRSREKPPWGPGQLEAWCHFTTAIVAVCF